MPKRRGALCPLSVFSVVTCHSRMFIEVTHVTSNRVKARPLVASSASEAAPAPSAAASAGGLFAPSLLSRPDQRTASRHASALTRELTAARALAPRPDGPSVRRGPPSTLCSVAAAVLALPCAAKRWDRHLRPACAPPRARSWLLSAVLLCSTALGRLTAFQGVLKP